MPVLCIDSRQSAVILRSIHGNSIPISELQVEGTPQTHDPVLLKSIPIVSDLWSPPIFPIPTIMIFGADTPVDHASVVESYRASGARSAGWSLAILESDGTWMIREHAPDATRVGKHLFSCHTEARAPGSTHAGFANTSSRVSSTMNKACSLQMSSLVIDSQLIHLQTQSIWRLNFIQISGHQSPVRCGTMPWKVTQMTRSSIKFGHYVEQQANPSREG